MKKLVNDFLSALKNVKIISLKIFEFDGRNTEMSKYSLKIFFNGHENVFEYNY